MLPIIYFLTYMVIPNIFWSQTFSAIENVSSLGFLTLIPPLLAIILAFFTKEVYFSLFLGIWSGTILLLIPKGFVILDLYHSFEKIISIIINTISNSWNASIIAQLFTIGGLIAIITKNGGCSALAETIAKKAKTPRSAQIFTSFIALFTFFDDYANCLITGPVMKPVTDKLKISREKLAFIVDATAAPIAGISLISTWIGYELSVIKEGFILSGVENPNAYLIFIQTLPYRFYNFFMLGFIIIIAVLNRDFGPMLKAEQNARKKETDIQNELKIRSPNNYKISNALIPILVLIFSTFFGIWYDGYRTIDNNQINALSLHEYILAILEASDIIFIIFKSSALASIVAIILSTITQTMSFFESINTWISGAKNLVGTVIILILAWSISEIITELGTSLYIIQIFEGNIPSNIMPMITFVLSSIIAFATGTSFGTMGILMPLAIPLATSLSGSADSLITIMTTGSILTGSIVGDHCSPISDTTILSAGGAECGLMQHIDTQLPYAGFVSLISIICGYTFIIMNIPIIVCYLIGFLLMISIVFFIGKHVD